MYRKQLIEKFKEAERLGVSYIGVLIELPGGAKEVIINGKSNFNDKLLYYTEKYDHECKMRACPEIKIVNVCFGNQFSTLQFKLGKELV